MTFTECAEFSESRQNSKVAWLPDYSISNKRYIPRYSDKTAVPLLSLGWYLFTMVSYNRYLSRGSNGNAYSIIKKDNVSLTSSVIPLVAMPFFGFCYDSLNSGKFSSGKPR